jgi:hypothetical protein
MQLDNGVWALRRKIACTTKSARTYGSTRLSGRSLGYWPHESLIHELAQQLAEFGMPISAAWILRPSSIAEYQPQTASYGPEVPLQSLTGTSQAEPRGHSPTTSDAGNPQRPRRRLRFRSSTLVYTKPLMQASDDAPEESWRRTRAKSRLR